MITVKDAFRKFRSRLELNDREQQDASRRQLEIRAHMDEKFDVAHDFLTGSYKRWTKTKPLKDVDIFCVLGAEHRHYRDKAPSVLLKDVEAALADKYGQDNVGGQRRSVTVRFGVTPDEEEQTGDKVMSFDVVPAFVKDDHYEIPDTATSKGWTETDRASTLRRRSRPRRTSPGSGRASFEWPRSGTATTGSRLSRPS